MRRLPSFVFAALAFVAISLTPASAEKRVALVIGNDRYPSLPAHQQLQKAANDARLIGDTLARLGFDVIRGENLDRRAMIERLDQLTQKLAPGDTAFFFFAGHGVTVAGGNYILPTDVPNVESGQETLLARNAIGEGDIVADLQARGVTVAVVVLDACRVNPFARPGVRAVGGERGLTRAQPVRGVFTIYSAGFGQTALDRLGDADPDPNSVFTRVFAPALGKPGLHLGNLTFEVREEVSRLAKTRGHDQRPAYYDETLGGRIYLAGRAPVVEPAAPTGPGEAERAWGATKDTASPAVLEAFIRQFGDSYYANLARARLEELKKTQTAVVAPPVAPTPPVDTRPQPAVGVFPPAIKVDPLSPERERALKPKDTFKECDTCPEMVVVPAGSFMMGSPEGEKGRSREESPQHMVTISKPYAVGKFHVTVDQFSAFVAEAGYRADGKCNALDRGTWQLTAGRSWRDSGFPQTGSHPVVCISWKDAKAYVAWLSKKTGKSYRLLAEAEWEYAARAGNASRFLFGNNERELCRYGNGADEAAKGRVRRKDSWNIAACNDGYAYTAPVGSFLPNAFGLFDMLGNAYQWLEDCWNSGYVGAPTDGSAWTSGTCDTRIVRGGSWSSKPDYLRPANRMGFTIASGTGDDYTGFRVARTLTP
jgi:formylglycine-generating enzyme required for sulfatase activity